MHRKNRPLKRNIPTTPTPEQKPFYFTDGARRLIKTSRKAEDARQEAVSCGHFVYLINPEKFYSEFEEGN